MKKIFCLAVVFAITQLAIAQPGGGGMNPERMKERLKERLVPELVSKAKVSEIEANKVVDIVIATQQETMKVRRDDTLDDDAKKVKLKEIREERNKKLKDIPLTEEQIKSVNEVLEEMQKNRMGGGHQRNNE